MDDEKRSRGRPKIDVSVASSLAADPENTECRRKAVAAVEELEKIAH